MFIGEHPQRALNRADAPEKALHRIGLIREPADQLITQRVDAVRNDERRTEQGRSDLVEVPDGDQREVLIQTERLEHGCFRIGHRPRIRGLVQRCLDGHRAPVIRGRRAAEGSILFEDQHSVSRVCIQRARGQSAQSRADHDGVVFRAGGHGVSEAPGIS